MELYQKYNGMVIKLAQAYFDDEADVEDAVQDVFVKMLSVQTKAPDGEEADPWFRVVAVNAIRDKYRSMKLQERLNQETAKTEQDLTDISDPCAIVERDELVASFMDRYDTLPDELRETMYLRYDQLMSYEEIAAKLSVPVGTVASRINRAKQLCGIE